VAMEPSFNTDKSKNQGRLGVRSHLEAIRKLILS
jgi:hypothetical protein